MNPIAVKAFQFPFILQCFLSGKIKRGKINAIDLGQLIRIAARAGLKPELRLDGGETSNDLTPAPEGEVSGDGR